MSLRTSTKVFISSVVSAAAALICLIKARHIFLEELQRTGYKFGVHDVPDYNVWHYIALAFFAVGVAAIIAATWLRKSENAKFQNDANFDVANGDRH